MIPSGFGSQLPRQRGYSSQPDVFIRISGVLRSILSVRGASWSSVEHGRRPVRSLRVSETLSNSRRQGGGIARILKETRLRLACTRNCTRAPCTRLDEQFACQRYHPVCCFEAKLRPVTRGGPNYQFLCQSFPDTNFGGFSFTRCQRLYDIVRSFCFVSGLYLTVHTKHIYSLYLSRSDKPFLERFALNFNSGSTCLLQVGAVSFSSTSRVSLGGAQNSDDSKVSPPTLAQQT